MYSCRGKTVKIHECITETNKYKIPAINDGFLLIKRKPFSNFAVWNKPVFPALAVFVSKEEESHIRQLKMYKVKNNINNELQMELSASHTRAFRGSQ